jgi:hypothetical protein
MNRSPLGRLFTIRNALVVGATPLAVAAVALYVHHYRNGWIRLCTILLGFAILMWAVTIFLSEVFETNSDMHESVEVASAVLVFWCVAGTVILVLSVVVLNAVHVYAWVTDPQKSTSLKVTVVIAMTLVSSVALFYFRLKLRFVYGCSEVCFGFIVAVARTTSDAASNSVASPTFLLAMLTASVYLIVRGLDNMHQGASKAPLDPFWIYIKSKIKIKEKQDNRVRIDPQ